MKKLKTYSETKRIKPFDWNKFLDRAIAKQITETELNYAIELAADWVTCACGNQCAIIPRDGIGEPYDDELSDLGCFFNDHIGGGNFHAARRMLKRIEKRSAKLITELCIKDFNA